MSGKRFKLVPEMEGRVARWYARQRGTASQIEAWRRQASELTDGLPNGATVLEVAPGPGYLASEIARLGRFKVIGLDVSRTFVDIASAHARENGVDVEFRHGDVARMPFESGCFDLIICQAAFKNFAEPLRALDEMHRVLRAGGTAIIEDLNRDASNAEIDQGVREQRLSGFNAFLTRFVLRTMLRRRAYTPAQLRDLVRESAFRTGDIRTQGIGVEVRLKKAGVNEALPYIPRWHHPAATRQPSTAARPAAES